MKLFPAFLAFLVLVGSACVTQAAPPSTPAQALPTPVPIEPAALGFELRLSEGKTQFQQGETIPVRLLFSNKGSQTLCLDTFSFPPPSLASFASFAVEPTDKATNPLGDLPPEQSFAYSGPGPERPVVLGEKPAEISLVLNEYLRFDQPGTFQIRATTNHVFAVAQGQTPPREGSFFGRGPAVTSAPLSIEIVPTDPQWQQAQVEAWRTFWAQQKLNDNGYWYVPTGVTRPLNDLRFLNTREAARAMIDRLGQDQFPRSSVSEAYFWRSGLVGYTDRSWLISAMKEVLEQPTYPVTQGFLDNLSTLQSLYHTARAGQTTAPIAFQQAKTKAALSNWRMAYNALSPKKGRAQAMTVHSLLETAWDYPLVKVPEVQRHVPQLVVMVPYIFADLPAQPQEYLLDDKYGYKEWQRVKSPRFVEPLRKVWEQLPHPSYSPSHNTRGNLILRHLYELAPSTGRPLILQEMASPWPRASFEMLSQLPDKQLPQLEEIWWQNLTSNKSDYSTAALLIGRYATPALKTRVQTKYGQAIRQRTLATDIRRGLEQYLTRIGG